jgi:hypothetical protein
MSNMKKILLVAVMAIMSLVSEAQNTMREIGTFTLQPKIGLGSGYLSGTWVAEPKEKRKLVAGIVIGVEGEYYAAKWLGVAAGVNYAMQGWKFNYEDESVITRLNYLNIPLTANFYVLKGLALKTGVQFGFLLNAKERVHDVDTDIKDNCKKFCFSIPVGLSYEFNNFVIDARYNFAVTRVIDNAMDKKRSDLIQLTVGYKFAL